MTDKIRQKRDAILDRAMNIRTSQDELCQWDRQAIIRSLHREVAPGNGLYQEIALSVEKQIKQMKLQTLTAPLIRELVCVEFLRRGKENEYKKYQRLGLQIADVDNIIFTHNEEVSSNNPHTPETTNMSIAGSVKKDFALAEIYSREVGQAHLKGEIHLHKLDFPDRPYCCGNNLEYIKKYGLNIASSLSGAHPARHAHVLILHMIKFAAMLQIHFSGAIGWEAVNVFLAPYLVGLSEKELYDLAQLLVYEFNTQNVAKGGQPIFSDINLSWKCQHTIVKHQPLAPAANIPAKPMPLTKRKHNVF